MYINIDTIVCRVSLGATILIETIIRERHEVVRWGVATKLRILTLEHSSIEGYALWFLRLAQIVNLKATCVGHSVLNIVNHCCEGETLSSYNKCKLFKYSNLIIIVAVGIVMSLT